jgi:ankyrin repeat protein
LIGKNFNSIVINFKLKKLKIDAEGLTKNSYVNFSFKFAILAIFSGLIFYFWKIYNHHFWFSAGILSVCYLIKMFVNYFIKVPVCLLLGNSNLETFNLFGRVEDSYGNFGEGRGLRISALLNYSDKKFIRNYNIDNLDIYRTRDDIDWFYVVKELIDIVPLIIIDGRSYSDNLDEEINYLFSSKPNKKFIFIVAKNKGNDPIYSNEQFNRYFDCYSNIEVLNDVDLIWVIAMLRIDRKILFLRDISEFKSHVIEIINERINIDEDALIEASTDGKLEVVRALLDKKSNIDINVRDNEDWTPILRATHRGYRRIVKELIANGADINAKTKKGNTSLMIAILEDRPLIVKMLLEHGAQINIKNSDGATALMAATSQGETDLVKTLLAKGAKVNIREKHGNTALMMATTNGHLEIAEILIENGAEINKENNEIKTALMMAPSKDYI